MSTKNTKITREAAEFVFHLQYEDLPSEARRIGKRCILDGMGLILAGSNQECAKIIRKHSLSMGKGSESTIFGKPCRTAPAPLAALVNGTAGHAMDWDDTQLSTTPDRIYGLLTHPTMPPLTAGLAVSETLETASGRDFMTAFLAGFEVECKIAEAIRPDHYRKGFHTSGTVGTMGAAVAAAKLLNLNVDQIRNTLGIAASMSSGIRVNFGTMSKPLHVGRAAQNGTTAAFLAQSGFSADMDALDGPWGYFQVFGGGFDADKIAGCFGKPFSIVDPGVSIKPYPCGVLTHPSMDTMLGLVTEHDIMPDDVDNIVLYAGSNILNPIRYDIAENELEAKFCMAFLLAAIVISRKAGVKEFTDEFVKAPQTQALMRKIKTEFDPEIEAKGWDKIRSRVEVVLKDPKKLVREADERYRGGPDNPMTEQELENKFTDCTETILVAETRKIIIDAIANFETIDDMKDFISLICT